MRIFRPQDMNLSVTSYPELTKFAGTSECYDNAIRDALCQAGNITRATEYRSCEKLGLQMCYRFSPAIDC